MMKQQLTNLTTRKSEYEGPSKEPLLRLCYAERTYVTLKSLVVFAGSKIWNEASQQVEHPNNIEVRIPSGSVPCHIPNITFRLVVRLVCAFRSLWPGVQASRLEVRTLASAGREGLDSFG